MKGRQRGWGSASPLPIRNCCHQMSYFKAKMHQIRLRLWLHPRPRWRSLQRSPTPITGSKGSTSKGRDEEERQEKGQGRGPTFEVRGSSIPNQPKPFGERKMSCEERVPFAPGNWSLDKARPPPDRKNHLKWHFGNKKQVRMRNCIAM